MEEHEGSRGGKRRGPRYAIPAGTHRVEEEIQRSRFITTVGYAPTVDAARGLLAAIREEFPDATHHCWAYVVGPPGSSSCIGLSDDGEPHGTAGRPMLTALSHSGVGDIVAVVTRYFGGTLLGKGGLVKAYTGGVLLALASMPRGEQVERSLIEVVIDYGHVSAVRRMLAEHEAESVEERFEADVTWRLRMPSERVAGFIQALSDVTAGLSLVSEVETA